MILEYNLVTPNRGKFLMPFFLYDEKQNISDVLYGVLNLKNDIDGLAQQFFNLKLQSKKKEDYDAVGFRDLYEIDSEEGEHYLLGLALKPKRKNDLIQILFAKQVDRVRYFGFWSVVPEVEGMFHDQNVLRSLIYGLSQLYEDEHFKKYTVFANFLNLGVEDYYKDVKIKHIQGLSSMFN